MFKKGIEKLVTNRHFDINSREESLSFLCKGVSFEGTVRCNGLLKIEGHVKGDIAHAKRIIIGREGRVESNIKGDDIILGGMMEGNITAFKTVEILPSGSIKGNIQSPEMVISSGAQLNGKCAIAKAAIQELPQINEPSFHQSPRKLAVVK